jgi:hypothetical protein
MKTKLALFVTLMAVALNALALFETDKTEGFFEAPPEPEVKILAAAAHSCSIQIRYNSDTPTGLEINYVGGGCETTEEAAIAAASFMPLSIPAKLSPVYGEPAIPPVYQCSITVLWDSATPSAVTFAFAGFGCESTHLTAVRAAVQAVACMHHPVRCRI